MLQLRQLRDWLGFTAGEVRAVILLSTALVAGHAVRSIDGLLPRRPTPDQNAAFDYRTLDSIFLARSETRPPGTGDQPAEANVPEGPVNINTADAEQLASLPGIGPVCAGRIVAYREAHGPFHSVEDLLAIRGIGQKRLAALQGLIVLK